MQLNNKTIVRTALFTVLVGALGYSFAAKSETKLIPFQGKLTDASGQVISDGAIVVQFKMYDAPVGGQAKWNGEVQMLSVNGGLVNTTLGTKASLKNVDFSSPTYLEITIDANGDNQIGPEDPPLLPRQSIIPAVYAIESGNARTLANHDWSSIFGVNDPTGKIPGNKIEEGGITKKQIANGTVTLEKMSVNSVDTQQLVNNAVTSEKLANEVISEEKLIKKVRDSLVPPGTIIAFGGENVPDGWMECNGRPLSSKDYPALYQAIGTHWGNGAYWENGKMFQADGCDFNVPQLHGAFLRGWNKGLTGFLSDPEAESRFSIVGGAEGDHVGSYQDDAFQTHNHKVYATISSHWIRTTRQLPHMGDSDYYTAPFSRVNANSDIYAAEEVNVTDSNPVRTAEETRPNNAYVFYIIKY